MVSVSNTISRLDNALILFAQRVQHRPDLLARRLQRAARIDHEIGARALFGIGDLAGQQRLEFFRRHARTRQHPLALHVGRRGHDDDFVKQSSTRRLEQKWDIEHYNTGAAHEAGLQKLRLRFAHEWMHDRFQPLDRLGIADNARRQRCAVDAAILGNTGKRRFNRHNRRAAWFIERMHGGV